jgi:DNA-binding IclR family transcriptional regulator
MREEKNSKYQAPALDKGLDILEFLSQGSIPLSQSEIAAGIGRNPNEVYRMLVRLEERGYISRDEISSKYKLTLKLYALSHLHSPVDEIRKAAEYPMQQLAGKLMQSCHLSVIDQDELMVIFQAKSPGPISLSIEEGARFPLLVTASGPVLLAGMKASERKKILSRISTYTELTKEEKTALDKELARIAANGYLIRQSELSIGVTDIVFPIGSRDTGFYAALTVSMLSIQLNKITSLEEIIEVVKETANAIIQKVGLNIIPDKESAEI